MKARKPRSGSIYKRFDKWWIKYYKDGAAIRESSKSDSYDDAERLLKRRQGEIVTGKFAGLSPERIRFRQLAEEVMDDYRANERKSVAHVERRLRLHLLPALGDIRVAALGTTQLKRYITERRVAKASNASINRELAIVKRAFHLGFRSDPPLVIRIPHIPMLEEHNVRKGFLEYDQFLALREALPEDLRLLLIVGYYTGARKTELLSLTWTQVNLTTNQIALHPGTTKNDQPRTLPIYGEMRVWLAMQKESRDLRYPECPFVFHRKGKPISSFRKAWDLAATGAELPGLLFHDLRRSAVRNMVRAGIPERVAMEVSGHKTRSVFDRYNIVSERDLAEAARKMESHIASLGSTMEAGTGNKRAIS